MTRLLCCLLPLAALVGGCDDALTDRCVRERGWCEGDRAFVCVWETTSGGRAPRVQVTACAGACHASWDGARCVAAAIPGDCRRPQRQCVDGHPATCDRSTWLIEQRCGPGELCVHDGDAPRCIVRPCSNGLDDDGDGRIDGDDPGCGFGDGEDEGAEPDCQNTFDDDGDGRIDGQDPGCGSADDDDEGDEPDCDNRYDDDRDGRIDLADPGCDDPGDDDESDDPACDNRRDDDGDGRVDLDDIGCADLSDDDESDDPPGPACDNGFDDDRDGLIDRADPGCASRDDESEADPDGELPACGNGVDDDGDGWVDWPDDPGCTASGDGREAQACLGREAPVVQLGASARGRLAVDGADGFDVSCGHPGGGGVDAVFAYRLAEAATLVAHVDDPETAVDASVAIRRACDDFESERVCGATSARIEDAPPGEYYVIVEGGGSERLVGSDAAVELPPDPEGYAPTDDIGPDGWLDGGRGAVDGYGRVRLDVAGVRGWVDVSLGERAAAIGDFGLTVRSALFGGAWRVVLDHPEGRVEGRPFDVRLTGDVGSGTHTIGRRTQMVGGAPLRALHMTQFGGVRPSVATWVVPSMRRAFDDVRYAIDGSRVTVDLPGARLPLTIYVALSYAEPRAVFEALVADVVVEPPGEAAGDFVLTITEE